MSKMFLSSVYHSRKLIKPKEGIVGTSDWEPVSRTTGDKPGLVPGAQSGRGGRALFRGWALCLWNPHCLWECLWMWGKPLHIRNWVSDHPKAPPSLMFPLSNLPSTDCQPGSIATNSLLPMLCLELSRISVSLCSDFTPTTMVLDKVCLAILKQVSLNIFSLTI